MKFNQLVDQIVTGANGFVVGKVKDLVIDTEEWKITHLEIELTKEASEQILGATPAMFNLPRNLLGNFCVTKRRFMLHRKWNNS